MADLATLDRAYHITMQYFVDRGQGLHYAELAADMGLSAAAGRQVLHDLMGSVIPAWVHPDTDYIVSFAPFHNLPTQYCITIDGEQKWFAISTGQKTRQNHRFKIRPGRHEGALIHGRPVSKKRPKRLLGAVLTLNSPLQL